MRVWMWSLLNVLIDYLTFSSTIHNIDSFIERLGLSGCNFIDMSGRHFYYSRKYYMGCNFYYDAVLDGKSSICVELSGSGCRTVEDFSGSSFDWLSFLRDFEAEFRSGEMHISRLDIAADDHDGILKFSKMAASCKHYRYICKSRRRIWTDGDEQEILFGSPKSDRRLRIYNKALEQGAAGPWWRVEMQMRNDNALSFLLNWFSGGDVGKVYAAVLLDYLRFTSSRVKHNHYDSVDVADWWSDFIGNVEACPQLYLNEKPYTILSVRRFLEKQCSSSLKLWLAVNNGDLSDLLDMVEHTRLNARQQQLLARIESEIL